MNIYANKKVTALIPAYNTATTITRAIDSVRDQVDRIIVYNDGSRDETAAVVQALSIPHLTLITADENRGIGAARQALLDAVDTEMAIWLDADDEFLPGRVARLKPIIASGADWVFDAAELVDGDSGQVVRQLPIADFLQQQDGVVWEFARNYIPSLGWAMIRTSAARQIGYDTSYVQAEDYEHLLRAILANKSICFCSQPGYRHYDYAGSVSRHLERQSAWSERALSQLGRQQVARRIAQSNLPFAEQQTIEAYYLARIKAWEALYQLTKPQIGTDWEMAYFFGVACYYAMQIPQAIAAFAQSLAIKETACGYNNRGVCRIRSGDSGGMDDIQKALQLMPHYVDAQSNQRGNKIQLTVFPLREQPIRDRYR